MKTCSIIVGLTVWLIVSGAAAAQGKKKPPDQKKEVRPSPNAKAILDLELAHQLIRYGRQEKNAEALLLAAQILHRTPARPFKADTSPAGNGPDHSPRSLLAEARKLSTAAQTDALAAATEKMLGEKGAAADTGPMTAAFTLGPRQTITWNAVSFKAGDRAEVHVSTGAAGTMTLEVIDESGNLVSRDNAPGSYYRCTFTPRSTGNFRIRLISSDNAPFDCKIYVD